MGIKILAQNILRRSGSLRAADAPEGLKNQSKYSGLILGGQVNTIHRMANLARTLVKGILEDLFGQ